MSRKFRWSIDGGATWTVETQTLPYQLTGVLDTDTVVVEPIGDAVSLSLPYDTDTLAYLARLPSTPSAFEMRAYNRFVTATKASGMWAKIVDCGFLCGHAEGVGLVGVKGALTPSWVGSGGTFVAGHGWAGGGTRRLDTGYKVPLGKQNSHAMGILVVSQGSNASAAMGNANTAITPMNSSSDALLAMASTATAPATYQPSSATGMWIGIRTLAASMALYRDDDKVITSTISSTTPDATYNVHVMGRNGASPTFYDQRCAFWFIAEDMLEADVVDFAALVQEVCGYLAAATTAIEDVTLETRAVLGYMTEMSRRRSWLLGALDTDTWHTSTPDLWADIATMTGEVPAVMVCDWVDTATPGRSADVAAQIAAIKAHYAAGGLISMQHHSGNPVTATLELEFDATQGTGTTYDLTGSPVTACLSGGSKRTEWLAYTVRVSTWLNELRGDDGKLIPVMLRWFHEIDGGWFWWSAETTAKTQQLYQDFVDQLRANSVRNALFDYNANLNGAVTPSFANYPGNTYIDILSGDYYDNSGASVTGLSAAQITSLTSGAVGRFKPRWYAEIGFELAANADATLWATKVGAVLRDTQTISAGIGLWRYPWGPTTGQSNSSNFQTMVASPKCITRARMVNAYARVAALAS